MCDTMIPQVAVTAMSDRPWLVVEASMVDGYGLMLGSQMQVEQDGEVLVFDYSRTDRDSDGDVMFWVYEQRGGSLQLHVLND